MAIFHSIATGASDVVNAPCRLAASAIDPEIRMTSKPNTVSPLTDTLRLKTCMGGIQRGLGTRGLGDLDPGSERPSIQSPSPLVPSPDLPDTLSAASPHSDSPLPSPTR